MPQCLKCHYDLRGTSADSRCPECGYPVALSLSGVRPFDRARSVALKVSVPFLIVFSVCGFTAFLSAATMEPFYRHANWSHFFGYVIFPTAALVLWALWASVVAALVWRDVLRWWWVILLILSIVPSLAMMSGMEGYLKDIIEMGSWDSEPP